MDRLSGGPEPSHLPSISISQSCEVESSRHKGPLQVLAEAQGNTHIQKVSVVNGCPHLPSFLSLFFPLYFRVFLKICSKRHT